MRRVFFTSDLHLEHAKIIKLAGRPFRSGQEMDETIIRRWNQTVRPGDLVYVLGDFGKGPNALKLWDELAGEKILIEGNHDPEVHPSYPSLFINYKGTDLLLVHRPSPLPSAYDGYRGWVVHGHTHNLPDRKAPMVNPEAKTINVNVEQTYYYPVSGDDLLRAIREGEYRRTPPRRPFTRRRLAKRRSKQRTLARAISGSR